MESFRAAVDRLSKIFVSDLLAAVRAAATEQLALQQKKEARPKPTRILRPSHTASASERERPVAMLRPQDEHRERLARPGDEHVHRVPEGVSIEENVVPPANARLSDDGDVALRPGGRSPPRDSDDSALDLAPLRHLAAPAPQVLQLPHPMAQ